MAYQAMLDVGIKPQPASAAVRFDQGIIVDALLGTGLNRPLRDDCRQLIAAMNRSSCPVVAVDLPSGLCGDSGQVFAEAVQADLTISLLAAKQGLYTGLGPQCSGSVIYDDLAVAAEHFRQLGPAIEHLDLQQCLQPLAKRQRSAHKGLFGHVVVIGGDYGMGGAAIMAAQAALKVGAGLVSLATRAEHIGAAISRQPEVMAHGIASSQSLQVLLAKASVVVIGPGLGQSPWSRQCLQQALACELPCGIDADALNLIAADNSLLPSATARWVMTPHPGAAARLLQLSTADINRDRFSAVEQLHCRFGGTIVLKGAGSLINRGAGTALCSYGNPYMASGGMGDVLSGLIGGFMAQGLELEQASKAGVVLHAAAADRVVEEHGGQGMTACDLFIPIRQLLNAN